MIIEALTRTIVLLGNLQLDMYGMLLQPLSNSLAYVLLDPKGIPISFRNL